MEVIKCQQTYRLRGIFKVTCEYKRKGKWAAGWHTGIDLYSDNQRIYGTCNGIVSATGFDKSYGNYIVVKNLEVENYHWYCHLSEIYVTVGERVSRNTIIGKMGNTGNSTGTHLHFEIRQKCNCYGKTENVADYMGISNKVGTYNTRNYQIKTNNAAEEIKILNRNTNLREKAGLDGKIKNLYIRNTTVIILEQNSAIKDGFVWDKVKIRATGEEGYMINNNYKK